MTDSTATLLEEMVRHAKGMLGSVEKWIARERSPRVPLTQPEKPDTNQLRDRSN
jgi:hypothetical protein